MDVIRYNTNNATWNICSQQKKTFLSRMVSKVTRDMHIGATGPPTARVDHRCNRDRKQESRSWETGGTRSPKIWSGGDTSINLPPPPPSFRLLCALVPTVLWYYNAVTALLNCRGLPPNWKRSCTGA